jgi:hypothetical protein
MTPHLLTILICPTFLVLKTSTISTHSNSIVILCLSPPKLKLIMTLHSLMITISTSILVLLTLTPMIPVLLHPAFHLISSYIRPRSILSPSILNVLSLRYSSQLAPSNIDMTVSTITILIDQVLTSTVELRSIYYS